VTSPEEAGVDARGDGPASVRGTGSLDQKSEKRSTASNRAKGI